MPLLDKSTLAAALLVTSGFVFADSEPGADADAMAVDDLTPAGADFSGTVAPPIAVGVTDYGADGNKQLDGLAKLRRPIKKAEGSPIRARSLRDEALSYGLRSGLVWRYSNIERLLTSISVHLDDVYNFNPLLIEGRWIPPVVSRFEDWFEVESSDLASTIKVAYRIDAPARVVGDAPDWRGFLMRRYPPPDAPVDAILPKDDAEAAMWDYYVRAGWAQGVRQADILFEANEASLTNFITGAINYHLLVSQGVMASVVTETRVGGIRVEDDRLNIGEIVYETLAPAAFRAYSEWDLTAPTAETSRGLHGTQN